MATVIKTRIIKIGNSRGVRIPKLLLEQANLGEEVEIELQEDQIVIRPFRPARFKWEEQFKDMAESGEDKLLDEELVLTTWDEEEWEW